MKSVALFILALAVVTPSAKCAQHTKDDKELLEGSWEVESSEDEGRDISATVRGLVLVLKDGKVTAKRGEEFKTGSYKLDPSKTPKWIDVTLGDDIFLAIYELKGDTLRICHGKPGDQRSTQFVSEAGSPNKALTVLKRQKE